MKTNVVYLHVKKGTNDVFYVGIGKNRRRAYSTERNDYWHNVANKYGYEVRVINSLPTYEDAKKVEIELIEAFGIRGEGQLTNITRGGDHGWDLVNEKGLSDKWKTFNTRVKEGKVLHPSKGTKWSKERRDKTMKNRKTNNPVTFRGVDYYSLRECEKETGISRYLIRKEVVGQ